MEFAPLRNHRSKKRGQKKNGSSSSKYLSKQGALSPQNLLISIEDDDFEGLEQRKSMLNQLKTLSIVEQLQQEAKDAQLARRVAQIEAQNHELVQRKRKQQATEDEELAKRLMEQEQEQHKKRMNELRQIRAKDEKLAIELATQDEANIREFWEKPYLNVEQEDDRARFWLILPGMAQAKVNVDHTVDGDASITVTASPKDGFCVTADAECKVILKGGKPLHINPDDVEAKYDEETQRMDIYCKNLYVGSDIHDSVISKCQKDALQQTSSSSHFTAAIV